MEKQSYIYKIANKINNKVYIGQTSQKVSKRWYEHKNNLRNNKHYNSHLQLSWNKYGEGNFEFSVLEECNINILDEREKYWIQKYDSMNRAKGYNKQSGGQESKTFSEEIKLKMSKARKGEGNGNSVLTEDEVKEIKLLLASTNLQLTEIAQKYNVDNSRISWIKNGRAWGNVRPELTEIIKNKNKPNNKEVELLKKNCETIRESIIVEFVFNLEIKICDLIKLNKSDINWNNNSIIIYNKEIKIIKISENIKTLLQEYLKGRNDNENALLITSKYPYGRLGRRTVEREVEYLKSKNLI